MVLQQEKAEVEKKIEGFLDSLLELGDSVAKNHVAKRIEQLNKQLEEINARIVELEGLTSRQQLSDIEFDILRQLLSVFQSSIDEMSIEQKRSAIRTIVRKVVWDGVNAHMVLFGVQEEELEFPKISSVGVNIEADKEEDTEELEQFVDVDYNEEEIESNYVTKTPWGEDSK